LPVFDPGVQKEVQSIREVIIMTELQKEQTIIVNTKTSEYFGKVKEVKDNNEYEISFFNTAPEKNGLIGKQCKIYYQNKEGDRSFFPAIISSINGGFFIKQNTLSSFRIRQSTRFKVDLPATVMNEDLLGRGAIRSDVLEGVTNVKTFNISTSGVGIISETPFQVNSSFTIEINFYDEKVRAIGEVKYCLKKDELYYSGVEFSVMSEETRGKLGNLLLALET
jgi:hypothetical protein